MAARIMVTSIFKLVGLATGAVCLTSLASAAEIKRSDHPLYGIVLEGTIVSGDYDKLRKVIDEECPAKYYNSAGYTTCADRIYLASPGGSVAEAMKIGRLLRTLRLATQIPQQASPDLRSTIIAAAKLKDPQTNYVCASACFFVYVAGIERNYRGDKGILGIHRPYLSDADLKTLSANQAMASATQVRTIVEAYLKEMGVPAKYADLMFSIPKDQVRWIDEADFEADFSGIIPELKDWIEAKCNNYTDVEKRLLEIFDAKPREKFTSDEEAMFQMLVPKMKQKVDCELRVKEKLRAEAWKAFQHP